MASLCYLTAVVFFVCCSTATVGKKNATVQPRNNTVVERKIEALKKTNNSTGCNLLVEKSKIEEILSKHDKSTATNVVNLKVSIYPGKKTRYFQELELPWASEVGRTIISLVRRARDTNIFASPVFTSILEVGTKEVDIEVKEETDGCLPPGEEGTDQIFDFLLHKLSHSEDKHVFKLCRIPKAKSIKYATYHCCRIAGERNLTICANYSSAVVKWALPIIIVVFVVSVLFVFPFVLQNITTYSTINHKFYKTSESHMSLISLVSKVFCEGRGPVKSFCRRCVFVVFTYLGLYFSDFFGKEWLRGLFIIWCVFFVFFNDIQMTIEIGKEEYDENKNKEKCIDACECIKKCENDCQLRPQWGTNIISCFTLPFCFLYEIFKCCSSWFDKYDKRFKSCFEKLCSCGCICFFYSCPIFPVILAFISLVCSLFYVPLVLAFLLRFIIIDLLVFFIWPHYCLCNDGFKYLGFFIRIPTFLASVFFTGMAFISACSTVVGLVLNAEFFNPFIAPITTIILYFWKHWRSSVEGQCLQLKTLIIEVCKEKSQTPKNRQRPQNRQERLPASETDTDGIGDGQPSTSRPDCKDQMNTGTTRNNAENSEHNDNGENNEVDNNFVIKFDDEDGEAMISIALYKEVESRILPLDHLLFFFFRRVILVSLYAFCLFIVMIAFRESGISESAQLISTIAGVMIPFVLNTIFADDHLPQKNSKNAATKEKLEHILKAKYENYTISVDVVKLGTTLKVDRSKVLKNKAGKNTESQKVLENEIV